MLQLLIAKSSDSLVATLTTMVLILAAMIVWLIVQRRQRQFVSISSLSGEPYLVPIAGGLVNVQVPSGLQPVFRSTGELVLLPRIDIGVQVSLNASIVSHEEGVEDPVRQELEAWAAQHDGEVTQSRWGSIATTVEQVDHAGREFELRRWLVGRGLTIVSVVAEIDLRSSAKFRIKSILAKIPRIIDQLQMNVHRHTLGVEQSAGEYVTYESNALIVRNIDKHDQAFLEKWESRAQDILRAYLSPQRLERITPEILDWCLTLCQRDDDVSKPTFEDVSKAFGVAFGNCCVRGLELRWGAVEVDGARHLVLRHAPSRLLLFPLRALDGSGSLTHRYQPLYSVANAYMQMQQHQRAA